jgi:hypothetical protein
MTVSQTSHVCLFMCWRTVSQSGSANGASDAAGAPLDGESTESRHSDSQPLLVIRTAMIAIAVVGAAAALAPLPRLPVDKLKASKVAASNLPPSLQAAALELGARKVAEEKQEARKAQTHGPGGELYRYLQHTRDWPSTLEGHAAEETATPTSPAEPLPFPSKVADDYNAHEHAPRAIRDAFGERLGDALFYIHLERQRDAVLYCDKAVEAFKSLKGKALSHKFKGLRLPWKRSR